MSQWLEVMQGLRMGFLFEGRSGNASLGRPLFIVVVSQEMGRGEKVGRRKGRKEGKGVWTNIEGCPMSLWSLNRSLTEPWRV